MSENELIRIYSPDDGVINKSNSSIILNSSPGTMSNGKVIQKKQISISIDTLSKLNVEQIAKLITIQARRIDLEQWELDILIEICSSSNSLDKGTYFK